MSPVVSYTTTCSSSFEPRPFSVDHADVPGAVANKSYHLQRLRINELSGTMAFTPLPFASPSNLTVKSCVAIAVISYSLPSSPLI